VASALTLSVLSKVLWRHGYMPAKSIHQTEGEGRLPSYLLATPVPRAAGSCDFARMTRTGARSSSLGWQ